MGSTINISFLEKTLDTAKITLVGDVRIFLEGKVSLENLYPTDALDFRFALGGATFGSVEEVGETIVLNQNAYVSRRHGRGALKCRSRRAPFDPFFLVGVDPYQKHSAVIEVEGASFSTTAFYGALLKHYPDGFLIAGEALFERLEGAYVGRCPKEGVSPIKEFDTYMGQESRGFALGYIVGLVFDPVTSYVPVDVLGRIFYENPRQRGAPPFHCHTHVALINERDRSSIDLERDIVGVRHLYHSSTMSYGKFFIYKVIGH